MKDKTIKLKDLQSKVNQMYYDGGYSNGFNAGVEEMLHAATIAIYKSIIPGDLDRRQYIRRLEKEINEAAENIRQLEE